MRRDTVNIRPVVPKLPVVELPASMHKVITSGHPWIYRDHVPKSARFTSGTWVNVKAKDAQCLGLWDATSPIALRIFSRKPQDPAALVKERVRAAWHARATLHEAPHTNAYRVIFGEGDLLPGLVIDRYADHLVALTYAESINTLLPTVVQTLSELDSNIQGIVHKHDDDSKGSRLNILKGQGAPATLEVLENGLKFNVNFERGQKSGLFLDHRDNRAWLETIAHNKSVLNLFAYTGAFGLYARRGGATQVTQVDISPGAIENAKHNHTLNGFNPASDLFVAEDVSEFLTRAHSQAKRYDVVICDPPSMARSKDQRDAALKAYFHLNEKALRVVDRGGLIATASCTAQVSPDAFHEVLAKAAYHAKVNLQIIHDVGHAPDHPVLVSHPEGRYLKFLVARVTAAS